MSMIYMKNCDSLAIVESGACILCQAGILPCRDPGEEKDRATEFLIKNASNIRKFEAFHSKACLKFHSCHLYAPLCGDLAVSNFQTLSIQIYCSLNSPQQIYHFYGSCRTVKALISGFAAGTLNGLLDIVGGQHAEHHRNPRLQRNLRNSF